MDNVFATLFELQLTKLKEEILNFKDETNLWKKVDGTTNTAGTLAKHVVGSLNFSVGVNIGNNGYVRDREFEFSGTEVSREKLVADIDSLIVVIKDTLGNIAEEKLEEKYVIEMHGPKSTRYYLTYFFGHLNYHLGQINYLRRILEQ